MVDLQKGERIDMENDEQLNQAEPSAANHLEIGHQTVSGEVEKISATVEQSGREIALAARLTEIERELAELKASASGTVTNPLRRTIPATTSELLAKHGIGEGHVDARALDAALSGLSLEQRIAVKTQLLRAGAVS